MSPGPASSSRVRTGKLREGNDSQEATQQVHLTTKRPRPSQLRPLCREHRVLASAGDLQRPSRSVLSS